MSEEVGIEEGEFDSNVSSLQSAVSEIDSSILERREYVKTNIQPFMDDLKTTIEALELLEKYKEMLNSDTNTLENVGMDMVENDEKLAKVNDIHGGPQPLRS